MAMFFSFDVAELAQRQPNSLGAGGIGQLDFGTSIETLSEGLSLAAARDAEKLSAKSMAQSATTVISFFMSYALSRSHLSLDT